MKSVDLNLLRVFLEVYRTGNISAAAGKLNVTQPAVSNALGRLNATLECRLFVRSGRGISPTLEAHNLYRKVNGSYKQLQRAFLEFNEFDPSQSDRHFRVSLSNYFDAFLPTLALLIQDQAPNITFERVQYRLRQNFVSLREGELDLILSAVDQPPEGFNKRSLMTDQMVLVSRHDHPDLSRGKVIDLNLLHRLRFASLNEVHERAMPAYHVLRERQIRIFIRTVSFTSLLEIVAKTDYVAIIPELLVRSWSYFPISQHSLPFSTPIPLSLIWTKASDHEAGHEWLRDIVTHAFSGAKPGG